MGGLPGLCLSCLLVPSSQMATRHPDNMGRGLSACFTVGWESRVSLAGRKGGLGGSPGFPLWKLSPLPQWAGGQWEGAFISCALRKCSGSVHALRSSSAEQRFPGPQGRPSPRPADSFGLEKNHGAPPCHFHVCVFNPFSTLLIKAPLLLDFSLSPPPRPPPFLLPVLNRAWLTT